MLSSQDRLAKNSPAGAVSSRMTPPLAADRVIAIAEDNVPQTARRYRIDPASARPPQFLMDADIAGHDAVTALMRSAELGRAVHMGFSCTGAPIFDTDGKLAAVLGIASVDSNLSEDAQAMTSAMIVSAARAIEERAFRERFAHEWIVSASTREDDAAALFAVDANQLVVGADRHARTMLADAGRAFAPGALSFWSVFEQAAGLFRDTRDDVSAELVPIGARDMVSALVSPPRMRRTEAAQVPATPVRTEQPVPPAPARGGIPPKALRRVREYIDAHLEESIGLKDLADVAGLSMFHFARAFKQSQGVTPNCYLFQRRVERAKELLADSELALSEIAIATGFSDQSHFARRFREHVGTTPAKFRWSKR